MQVIYRGLFYGGYPIQIAYNRGAQQSTQYKSGSMHHDVAKRM